MVLAGKHGTGVLSIASTSSEGLAALPTQWAFAEESAKKHGQTVSRRNWRVLMSWHIAETREQARQEALYGLQRWHNEYNVDILGRPGAVHVSDPWQLMDQMSDPSVGGAAVVGTPDDLVAAIRKLYELTGGFGVVIGFAHDWANHEATRRSWDLVARYVIPELNGQLRNLHRSADFLRANQAGLMDGASKAVLAKIASTPGAMEALQVTMAERAASSSGEWRPGADISNAESSPQ
jgi:limonene 1,2-monooxygenase